MFLDWKGSDNLAIVDSGQDFDITIQKTALVKDPVLDFTVTFAFANSPPFQRGCY
jgi:hypothetical protein